MNTYFACLEQMDEVERGNADTLLTAACDMLKVIGLQAYTQPLRHDETDKNVISIERFRNHVWWVGGNARVVRACRCAMYSSVPMVDLLAEVCRNGISVTSQWSNEHSFWTEGFTADGAGWGHGKQCLVWGYPIDGTFNCTEDIGHTEKHAVGTELRQKECRSHLELLARGKLVLLQRFHASLPGSWFVCLLHRRKTDPL